MLTKKDIDDKIECARASEMIAWNRGDSRTANRYRDIIDWLLDRRMTIIDE